MVDGRDLPVKALELVERNWARRKIDEDVPVPLSTSDCVEWIVSLTKALHFSMCGALASVPSSL